MESVMPEMGEVPLVVMQSWYCDGFADDGCVECEGAHKSWFGGTIKNPRSEASYCQCQAAYRLCGCSYRGCLGSAPIK
jgi:hypothetical protein